MKFQAQKEYFLTCFVDVIDAVEVVDVSEQHRRLHHWNHQELDSLLCLNIQIMWKQMSCSRVAEQPDISPLV